jgi:hypothetical protein
VAAEECSGGGAAAATSAAASASFRAFLTDTVLLSAVNSTCEACARGMGRCQRCAGGAPPHSPHMSFKRVAAALAGFGAEPTPAALARAKAASRGGGNPFAGATLTAWQTAWNARSRQQAGGGGGGGGKKAGGGGGDKAAACCALCGAPRAPKKCARCREARFCDEECLLVGWPLHAPARAPAAAEGAPA